MNDDVLVIMMFQCRYINRNKRTTLMTDANNVGSFTCMGAGSYGKSLYLLFNIAKPKTTPKIVYFKNSKFNFLTNKNSFYVIQMYDSKLR